MSISMKTLLGFPVFQVSKTTSLPRLALPAHSVPFRRRLFQALLLLALFSRLSFFTAFGGTNGTNDNPIYVYTNRPPKAPGGLVSPPGGPWKQVAGTNASGGGTTTKVVPVPANGSVTLAALNH